MSCFCFWTNEVLCVVVSSWVETYMAFKITRIVLTDDQIIQSWEARPPDASLLVDSFLDCLRNSKFVLYISCCKDWNKPLLQKACCLGQWCLEIIVWSHPLGQHPLTFPRSFIFLQHLCSVPLPAGFSRGYSCVLFPNMCFFILFFFFFFWPRWAACRILVPPRGSEPALLALEARSLNHWTTREVPCFSILNVNSSIHSCFFLSEKFHLFLLSLFLLFGSKHLLKYPFN